MFCLEGVLGSNGVCSFRAQRFRVSGFVGFGFWVWDMSSVGTVEFRSLRGFGLLVSMEGFDGFSRVEPWSSHSGNMVGAVVAVVVVARTTTWFMMLKMIAATATVTDLHYPLQCILRSLAMY